MRRKRIKEMRQSPPNFCANKVFIEHALLQAGIALPVPRASSFFEA